MTWLRKGTIFFFMLLMLAPAGNVLARQTFNSSEGNLNIVAKKAGSETDIEVPEVVARVIQTAFSIVGLAFLILMVYAGFRWMTARGNDENVTKARDTIIGSIIGLAIVVSGFTITSFITSRVLNQEKATQTTQQQQLGGEALGCCRDRIGKPQIFGQAEIAVWGCSIKTYSACETDAKKTSSGDQFTEFEWDGGVVGVQCTSSC